MALDKDGDQIMTEATSAPKTDQQAKSGGPSIATVGSTNVGGQGGSTDFMKVPSQSTMTAGTQKANPSIMPDVNKHAMGTGGNAPLPYRQQLEEINVTSDDTAYKELGSYVLDEKFFTGSNGFSNHWLKWRLLCAQIEFGMVAAVTSSGSFMIGIHPDPKSSFPNTAAKAKTFMNRLLCSQVVYPRENRTFEFPTNIVKWINASLDSLGNAVGKLFICVRTAATVGQPCTWTSQLFANIEYTDMGETSEQVDARVVLKSEDIEYDNPILFRVEANGRYVLAFKTNTEHNSLRCYFTEPNSIEMVVTDGRKVKPFSQVTSQCSIREVNGENYLIIKTNVDQANFAARLVRLTIEKRWVYIIVAADREMMRMNEVPSGSVEPRAMPLTVDVVPNWQGGIREDDKKAHFDVTKVKPK